MTFGLERLVAWCVNVTVGLGPRWHRNELLHFTNTICQLTLFVASPLVLVELIFFTITTSLSCLLHQRNAPCLDARSPNVFTSGWLLHSLLGECV